MDDGTLLLFLYGPPLLSVVLALTVLARMVWIARGQVSQGFAWPSVIGATVPQLATWLPWVLKGGSLGVSTLAAIKLLWGVAAVFCILGLVIPPRPARRWMFLCGLAEIGLAMLFMAVLSGLGGH